MKFIKLECPNCGGNLRVDETAEKATCIHCNFDFLVERQTPEIHNHYYGSAPNASVQRPIPIQAKNVTTKGSSPVLAVFIFVLIFLIFFAAPLIGRFLGTTKNNDTLGGFGQSIRTAPQSNPMIDFVQFVFGKPLSQITAEDYNTIQYLKLGKESNSPSAFWTIAYSMEDYKTAPNFEDSIKEIVINLDEDIDKYDLQIFGGLTAMHLPSGHDLANSYDPVPFQHMKNLTAYSGSFNESLSEASDQFASDPSQIEMLSIQIRNQQDVTELLRYVNLKELDVRYFGEEVEDLQQLSNLKHLSRLTVDSIKDISWISSLTQLKELSIDGYGILDYTVLHGLPYLEQLEIYSGDALKSLDFVTTMPNLKVLTIDFTKIISLAPLEGKKSLQSLRLNNNTDLADVSSLSSLTSLTSLYLDRMTAPDLSNLNQLADIALYGSSFPSIQNLSALKNITLKYGGELSPSAFAGFGQLESLSLVESELRNVHEFNTLPNLQTLALEEVDFKFPQDSLGIFQLEHVTSLTIDKSNLYFAIKEGQLETKDNTTLTELYFSADLIDRDNDYSQMPFDTYPQLCEHLLAIEVLHLPNQKITSLEFTSHMPALRELDVSDNYITDISPLTQLTALENVIVQGNIIANIDLLDEKINALK